MWIGKTWSQLKGMIRDVTEECTFEWVEVPSLSWAKLWVSDKSGTFSDGETVVGNTSGATATVITDRNVYVAIEDVLGEFQTGETVSGQSSGATATLDSFEPEKVYPNNITHGTFPDSLITKDLDDYLQVESSRTGAGYVWRLRVRPPKEGLYLLVPMMSAGSRVGNDFSSGWLKVYSSVIWFDNYVTTGSAFLGRFGLTDLDKFYPLHSFYNVSLMSYIGSFDGSELGAFYLRGYISDEGTARFNLHRITVLEVMS